MQGSERHFSRLPRRRAGCRRASVIDIISVSSSPLEFESHRLVVDMDELRQRLDRSADRGLFANDQRHRAEVGEAAAIGHPQPEFLDAGGRGGSFQQAAEPATAMRRSGLSRQATGSLALRSIAIGSSPTERATSG